MRSSNTIDRQLVDKLRPVFCVEELAFWLVDTLVGVRTEEVTLSLEKVRRNALCTVCIVVRK